MKLSELNPIGRVIADEYVLLFTVHSQNAPIKGQIVDVDTLQYRVSDVFDSTSDAEREEGLEYVTVKADAV